MPSAYPDSLLPQQEYFVIAHLSILLCPDKINAGTNLVTMIISGIPNKGIICLGDAVIKSFNQLPFQVINAYFH